MSHERVILIIFVAILLGMNGKATSLILRDSLSERTQQTMQLLLVWLLPIIGATIVFAVHRPAEKPSEKYRESPAIEEEVESFRSRGRSRANDDDGGDE